MTSISTSPNPTGAVPGSDLDELFAQSPLPALTGPEAAAERLVLLVHRGVDWQVWGGTRRVRYWDALTDRVRAATYAGPTLSEWWRTICTQITSTPRTASDRADTAMLLAHPDQRGVLDALHRHADTLVLRVRVLIEHNRADTPENQADPESPETLNGLASEGRDDAAGVVW